MCVWGGELCSLERSQPLLHWYLLRAGSSLLSCLRKAVTEDFLYWFIWSNFFWIGARHPWEESIFHITVCSYSYREKIYYFSILGTGLFTTTSDFKEINRIYIVQYPHVKLWVLPARFCSLLLVMAVVLDPWLIPAVSLTSYSFFL